MKRNYIKHTKEALKFLALKIKLGRKEMKMSESELSERIGISRTTLQKIEKADPKVEIGLYFDAAAITGVLLFAEEDQLRSHIKATNNLLMLLPQKIRKKEGKEVIDDF